METLGLGEERLPLLRSDSVSIDPLGDLLALGRHQHHRLGSDDDVALSHGWVQNNLIRQVVAIHLGIVAPGLLVL